MRIALVVAAKDLRQRLRDRSALIMGVVAPLLLAAIISLAAHFLVGAAKTLVTGRSWLNSGTEMTVVGAIEAVITYALGVAFSHI